MTDYEEIAHQCHTDDGIDHGRRHLEECLEAAIYKHADGFPAQVTIKNCHDCVINIYPSQTKFVEKAEEDNG